LNRPGHRLEEGGRQKQKDETLTGKTGRELSSRNGSKGRGERGDEGDSPSREKKKAKTRKNGIRTRQNPITSEETCAKKPRDF